MTNVEDSNNLLMSFDPNLAKPSQYVTHLARAKKSVKIPVIASLNGVTPGGWTSYARNLQDAGADALELNLYYVPTDFKFGTWELEKEFLEVLQGVKASVSIPVAVKLSPFFTNFLAIVENLVRNGAEALVLFNRSYESTVDLDTMKESTQGVLSTSADVRMPINWISLLYGNVQTDFAATSGIHTSQDAANAILAGASITQVCSSLLKNGITHLRTLEEGLRSWTGEQGYQSVREMKGKNSRVRGGKPQTSGREQYLKTLVGYQMKTA
jgi:dihydroorotate dehydrogenase (fumarate)